MSEASCVHCGERIVWEGNTFYPSWQHQPAGASFRDGMYTSCHLTAAEPREGAHTAPPASQASVSYRDGGVGVSGDEG